MRSLSWGRVLVAVAIVALAGCGTMWSRAMRPTGTCTRPMGGVSGCAEFGVGCVFDFPLSLAADLIFLPYDLVKPAFDAECRSYTIPVVSDTGAAAGGARATLLFHAEPSDVGSSLPFPCSDLTLRAAAYENERRGVKKLVIRPECLICAGPDGVQRETFGTVEGLELELSGGAYKAAPGSRGVAEFSISNHGCKERAN